MTEVANIERFALHDGPGIRTTVFFKGCPLHCPWCANPETWTVRPNLMYDVRKCLHCKHCARVCGRDAITFSPSFSLDQNGCSLCTDCVRDCPGQALSIAGTSMRTDEILEEVEKDRKYYERSGGGLTVSGGEPFVQFDSLLDLLVQASGRGLSTAVETTGMYPLRHLQKAEPYIDLFLFDFKHVDAGILKAVTGGDLDCILENLSWLARHCPSKVIVRIPVIPGFNSDPDTLDAILDKVAGLGLSTVHLLPYHSLGKNKWEMLSKTYAFPTEMMDKAELQPCLDHGVALGLHVQAGG